MLQSEQTPRDYRREFETLLTNAQQTKDQQANAWVIGAPPEPVELWRVISINRDDTVQRTEYGYSRLNLGTATQLPLKFQVRKGEARPVVRNASNLALTTCNVVALYAPVADADHLGDIAKAFGSQPELKDGNEANRATSALILRGLTTEEDPYAKRRGRYISALANLGRLATNLEVDPRRYVAQLLGRVVTRPSEFDPTPTDERIVSAVEALHTIDAIDQIFWSDILKPHFAQTSDPSERTAFDVPGLLDCWQRILQGGLAGNLNPAIIPSYMSCLLEHLATHDTQRDASAIRRALQATSTEGTFSYRAFIHMMNSFIRQQHKQGQHVQLPQLSVDRLLDLPEALKRFLAATLLNKNPDPTAALDKRALQYKQILDLLVWSTRENQYR